MKKHMLLIPILIGIVIGAFIIQTFLGFETKAFVQHVIYTWSGAILFWLVQQIVPVPERQE